MAVQSFSSGKKIEWVNKKSSKKVPGNKAMKKSTHHVNSTGKKKTE